MSSIRHYRYRLEYRLLTGFDRTVNRLPNRTAHQLGRLAAFVGRCLCQSKIKEGRRRLKQVYGSRFSEREQRRIIQDAWCNLMLSAIDFLRVGQYDKAWFERHTNARDIHQRVRPLIEAGRGGVIACAHMGSWELAAVTGKHFNIPVFAIAAPQKNPYFNQWMNELRSRSGIDTLLRGDPNLIRKVVRRLRDGQFLAILPDIRVPGQGIPTPFLGHTANIGPGMALFARMANVPIMPCPIYRNPDGTHHFAMHPTIEPDLTLDRDADITRMTHQALAIIDRTIQQHPDQWFWFNKRWILDPVPRS